MLGYHLHRYIPMPFRLGGIELDFRGHSSDKTFLMRVRLKNKALPIDPCIQMEMGCVIEHLKTGFRVGGKVQFRIIQRKNQPVIRTSVNVTQHKIEITQGYLSPKVRQQVSTLLIMPSLPFGNVLISIVGILI